MCFFPRPNLNIRSSAYKAGMREFACGCCPECLRSRSSLYVVRSYYEAKEHLNNCMVTLTYDNFERDARGRLTGRELPVDRSLHVCKRDVQLFMKRVRKKFGNDIKYLIAAEYGSRTHRAHYHAILFGVKFEDLVPFRRSKRGNIIFRSHTLDTLWNHGICTVDSKNINSAVARYCTKYFMKNNGVEDTFMLSSNHLGEIGMLKAFNGISYVIEGKSYPIPRSIWNIVASEELIKLGFVDFDYHYVNRSDCSFEQFQRGFILRSNFFAGRNSLEIYQKYLDYWSNIHSQIIEKPLLQKIRELPQDKFASYKEACMNYLANRSVFRYIPRSSQKSRANALSRAFFAAEQKLGTHLPYAPCLNRASDTIGNGYSKCVFSRLQMLHANGVKRSELPLRLRRLCGKSVKSLLRETVGVCEMWRFLDRNSKYKKILYHI